MKFTVITAAGSITPIEADCAEEAARIIEEKHGWTVVFVIDGAYRLKSYRGQTWRHLTPKILTPDT